MAKEYDSSYEILEDIQFKLNGNIGEVSDLIPVSVYHKIFENGKYEYSTPSNLDYFTDTYILVNVPNYNKILVTGLEVECNVETFDLTPFSIAYNSTYGNKIFNLNISGDFSTKTRITGIEPFLSTVFGKDMNNVVINFYNTEKETTELFFNDLADVNRRYLDPTEAEGLSKYDKIMAVNTPAVHRFGVIRCNTESLDLSAIYNIPSEKLKEKYTFSFYDCKKLQTVILDREYTVEELKNKKGVKWS